MSKFTLSPDAISDLDLIWAYIAQDNRQAADDVIGAAYRLCAILGEHPELGRVRSFSQSALAGLRSFVITDFPNYVIFYRVKGKAVEILRVLQGRGTSIRCLAVTEPARGRTFRTAQAGIRRGWGFRIRLAPSASKLLKKPKRFCVQF